ncbi:TolC family protein [Parabacteroides sp. PF5-9]|uniref:TolC family protein n=1 Tax=Parabacteroides sp. PF5-9 TaxID=1742404 RepID=UPI0032AEBA3A
MATATRAQQVVPMSYAEYMEKVTTGNIEYAAEKLNVNISEAEVVASKVFNDPTLAVSYFNNSEWDMEMGYGTEIELSKVFTFGKRKAGINLAKSEKELTQALLADYFRNLRAYATISYLEAVKQYELHQVKQDSYTTIRQLAVSDSIRYAVGEIMEVDAIQTRLEAELLQNELLQSQTELYNAFAELNLLTGSSALDTVFQPKATLQMIPRDFMLSQLVSTALDNRSDLVAAMKNKEVASRALTLVRRERNTEIELSLSANLNARVDNEIAPAPSFTGYAAGIAIPLKFSNLNKGNVKAAKIRQQQAEIQYQQVELQIQTEVMQSYHRYQSLATQVKRYQESLLADARKVIDGKLFSYSRGEVSLLEVLDAQRTYNDVQAQYIETLFNHATALVELERDAGIWDIEL